MCSCVENIKTVQVKSARKDHECMASVWLREFLCAHGRNNLEMSFSDLRKVVATRNDNWKIKKGQPYIRQTNKQEGELFEFICRP